MAKKKNNNAGWIVFLVLVLGIFILDFSNVIELRTIFSSVLEFITGIF